MNINDMKILSLFDKINYTENLQEYLELFSLNLDSFSNLQEVILSSKSEKYDLVVLDSSMGESDAVEFLKKFRHMYKGVPIVFITDQNDITLQEKVLKLGSYDVLTKPVSSVLLQAKLDQALRLKKAEAVLKDETILLQHEVSNAIKVLKNNEHELLDILAQSSAYREHGNDGHTFRVAHYCKVLAKAAGLNDKIQDIAFHASRIYDIGKIAIPDAILLKKEKLTDEEYELIKNHARLGFDLLKYTQGEYLKAAAVISYSHHEKYDGSGYPIGLKRETIPILGRIVAIVDVFDALTSVKRYRDAWSVEDACKLLVDEKNKHFDPKFVDLFLENIDEINSIKVKFESS